MGEGSSFSTFYACVLSFIHKPESKYSWFVISKWKYMIIFYPNMIYFWRFQLEKYEKSGFAEQSICIKISEAPNSPTTNTGSSPCILLIANHVFEFPANP